MKTIMALFLVLISINVTQAKAQDYPVEVNIELPETQMVSFIVVHAKELALEKLQELMATLDCRYIRETPVKAVGVVTMFKTKGYIRGTIKCPKPYRIVAAPVKYAGYRSETSIVSLKVFLLDQQIQHFEGNVPVETGFCR